MNKSHVTHVVALAFASAAFAIGANHSYPKSCVRDEPSEVGRIRYFVPNSNTGLVTPKEMPLADLTSIISTNVGRALAYFTNSRSITSELRLASVEVFQSIRCFAQDRNSEDSVIAPPAEWCLRFGFGFDLGPLSFVAPQDYSTVMLVDGTFTQQVIEQNNLLKPTTDLKKHVNGRDRALPERLKQAKPGNVGNVGGSKEWISVFRSLSRTSETHYVVPNSCYVAATNGWVPVQEPFPANISNLFTIATSTLDNRHLPEARPTLTSMTIQRVRGKTEEETQSDPLMERWIIAMYFQSQAQNLPSIGSIRRVVMLPDGTIAKEHIQ